MKMNRWLLAAAGALGVFLAVETAEARSMCSIGGVGMYGSGEADPKNAGTPSVKGEGGMGGVVIGCDQQIGNFFVGAELEALLGKIAGSAPDGNYLTWHGETDAAISTLFRFGTYIGTPNTKVYALVGASWFHDTAKMKCPPGALFGVCSVTGPFEATDTKWNPALTVGGGVEHWFVLDRTPVAFALEGRYSRGSASNCFGTPLGETCGKSDRDQYGVFAKFKVALPPL